MGDFKGGMHLRDGQPDDQQHSTHSGELTADIRRADEQPFAEKSRRDDQGQEEHHPLDHVVEGSHHLGVGPCFHPQRLPGIGHVAVPLPLLGGGFGPGDQLAAPLVKRYYTAVLDGVFPHSAQPRLVEVPHIPGGDEGDAGQRLFLQQETLATRFLFAGVSPAVEQQHAVPHQYLETVFGLGARRAENHSRAQPQGIAELPRRHVALVEDPDLGHGGQKSRVHHIEEGCGDARENHDRLFVSRTADRSAQGAVRIRCAVMIRGPLAQIGGDVDYAGLRVEDIHADCVLPGGKPGNFCHAARVGLIKAQRSHPFERPGGSIPALDGDQGSGHRRVGTLALARIGARFDFQGAQVVLEDRAEVLQTGQKGGVVERPREDAVEQGDLPFQVLEVHPARQIQRGVDLEAAVVHGGKGQGHQPGAECHLAVDPDAARHEGGPRHPFERADAVDQCPFGIEPQPLSRLGRVLGEPAAKRHEKAFEDKAGGVVPDPELIGLARKIEADEQIQVQRLEHLFGVGSVAAGVAVQKVHHTQHILEMRRSSQQHDGTGGRMVAQIAGQFQECGDATGSLGAGRQCGHHRSGVVVGFHRDGIGLQHGVGPGNHTQDVPRRPLFPVHARLHPHLCLVFAEPFLELLARLPADPETGQIERDFEEFFVGLPPVQGVGLDEDHGPRPQISGVQPAVPAVELHQHDASLYILAVEGAEFTLAAVDHGGVQATGRERGGADQVGPEAAERKGLVLFHELQLALFVHGHSHGKLLAPDVLHTPPVEFPLHELGGTGAARVAGYSRLERSQEFDGLANVRHLSMGSGSMETAADETAEQDASEHTCQETEPLSFLTPGRMAEPFLHPDPDRSGHRSTPSSARRRTNPELLPPDGWPASGGSGRNRYRDRGKNAPIRRPSA